jgi:hypothetical protein
MDGAGVLEGSVADAYAPKEQNHSHEQTRESFVAAAATRQPLRYHFARTRYKRFWKWNPRNTNPTDASARQLNLRVAGEGEFGFYGRICVDHRTRLTAKSQRDALPRGMRKDDDLPPLTIGMTKLSFLVVVWQSA